MKVITMANRKGGAGKSTLTRAIASALHYKKRRTHIIDLDQQGTVGKWLDLNAGALPVNEDLLTIELVDETDDSSTLRKVGSIVEDEEYDYLLIDTKGESSALTSAIGAQSDLVLVPTNGSRDDFEPTIKTYLEIKATLDRLEQSERLDEIFRIVFSKRMAVGELSANLAGQRALIDKFTCIDGPMINTSHAESGAQGTTIDRLLEQAEIDAESMETAADRRAARTLVERHTKTLSQLDEMMTDLLGEDY